MSQLLKSSSAMSAATMSSRVLGLVREMVYASFMGASWVTDAFMLAFMVPNLFRRLLGEGALTAAFIPIFKEKEKTAGETEMWRAANAVISGLMVSASAVVAFGILGISAVLLVDLPGGAMWRLAAILRELYPGALVICLIALGLKVASGGRSGGWRRASLFASSLGASASAALLLGGLAIWAAVSKDSGGGKTLLMLQLLRVMFPYVLLVCLAAIFMGMLNARGHFFVPAMGATMLNIVMIASVLWLAPRLGARLQDQIFGLAIGVIVAGVVQASFQWPLLRKEGFRYQWVPPWGDETVRRVVAQMVPGAIGVAAFQINVLVTQGMAFCVESGVLSSFAYAVRLMELPQGVFGISLATYFLPTLSGLAAEMKYQEFRATLAQGRGWLVFVNLLAGALLLALAEPMIRLLFEHGRFHEDDTTRSAQALACLAPGLVAFSVVNILARAFYALGDTRTPMRISVFCLAVNLVLSAALVWWLKQAGLGIANTLSAMVNMSLLLYALRKKLKRLELSSLRRPVVVLFGGAVLAGSLAWGVAWLWSAKLGHDRFVLRLGEVFVPIALAALVYLGVAATFKTSQSAELLALFRFRWRRERTQIQGS